MNTDLNKARRLIYDIIHENQKLEIPIIDSNKQRIGRLTPLNLSSSRDMALLESLTCWRNRARRFFFTQFKATRSRTQKWLEGIVLKDYSRLLFLIHSLEKSIGCYGFKHLSDHSVELDQLIRGEMGGHPRLIYYAEIALVVWLFETFKVKQVEAYVLSDNHLVLEMHKTLGFKLAEKLALEKIEIGDEIHLKMSDCSWEKRGHSCYAQKVKLLKSDFAALTPIYD